MVPHTLHVSYVSCMFLSHLTSYHNLMILDASLCLQSQQHFYHNNVSFSSLLANSFRVPSTIQVRTRCKPGGIGDGRQRHSAAQFPSLELESWRRERHRLRTRKTSKSHGSTLSHERTPTPSRLSQELCKLRMADSLKNPG